MAKKEQNPGNQKKEQNPRNQKKEQNPRKGRRSFKRGDLVYWAVKVNGIYRKYEGVVVTRVNRNLDAEKVSRKINKKLNISIVLDATARIRSKRNTDSYIIRTVNSKGRGVLHWPLVRKLRPVTPSP